MPSNEERRQAAREKLAKQNERREADERRRKIKAGAIAGAVVVALVAAGCYIWLPQGPRAPLRVGAENRFKSTHVNCDFKDRDAAAELRSGIQAQRTQNATMRQRIADAQKTLGTKTGAEKTQFEEQIKTAIEQTDQSDQAIAKAEKEQLPILDKQTARNKQIAKPNGTDVPKTGTVSGTITTNSGAIGFELDRSKAACNVETFVTLIQAKYFDDTTCHRETNQPASATSGLYVLQCGDPTGSGAGGPGWTSPDEYPTFLKAAGDATPMSTTQNVVFPAGTIAVANGNKAADPMSGQQGVSNTGSSQFFLVYKDTTLPATFSVIGKIDDAGLTVLQQIAKKGIVPADGAPAAKPNVPTVDGKPKETVTISSMALAS